MEITEVRIKLMEEPGERLKAFCSITFDNCFVVRDLKIIDGSNGPFVAMPSRKLTAHCPGCGMKNHLAGAVLQPVRQAAERCPRAERRRRPRKALCRHRPPDQFSLPRNDSGRCRSTNTTRKSSGRSSPVMFRATTISTSNTAMRRAADRRGSISRMPPRPSSRTSHVAAKGPAPSDSAGKPHYRRDSAERWPELIAGARHRRRPATHLEPASFRVMIASRV